MKSKVMLGGVGVLTLVAACAATYAFLHDASTWSDVSTRWRTAGQARDAGFGWLPAALPDSAFDIVERHDLDLNTREGYFSLAETTSPFRSCAPMSSAQRSDFDKLTQRIEDPRSVSLRQQSVLLVSCVGTAPLEKDFVVVAPTSGAGFYWSAQGECPRSQETSADHH